MYIGDFYDHVLCVLCVWCSIDCVVYVVVHNEC